MINNKISGHLAKCPASKTNEDSKEGKDSILFTKLLINSISLEEKLEIPEHIQTTIGSLNESSGVIVGQDNMFGLKEVNNFVDDIFNPEVDKKQIISKKEIKFAFDAFEHQYSDVCFPIFFPKRETGLNHSILFYKEKESYHILIKPNIQLSKVTDPLISPTMLHVGLGADKIIKTTGLEIVFSSGKIFSKVKRAVTFSESFNGKDKGDIFKNQDEMKIFEQNGFRRIDFSDIKDCKVIYRTILVADYLGENLNNLISQNPDLISNHKITILKQLCDQLNDSICDIKLNNTMFDDKMLTAKFIDSVDKKFTYTSKVSGANKDDIEIKGVNLDPEQITKQQIFGFCLLCYYVFGLKNKHIEGTKYSDPKPEFIELDEKNPFARLTQDAYLEKISSLDDCKKLILSILDYETNPRC